MPEITDPDQTGQEAIERHFDELAPWYDRTTEWRRSQEIIAWFQTYLGYPGRCLDLGTGTGIIGGQIKLSGAFVVGLDTSHEMLQVAQPQLSAAVRADATVLPFSDSSFDTVSIRQLLHYVDDGACLQEAARVTRPGGRLGCAQVSAPDEELADWWREIKRRVQPLRKRFYSSRDLQELVSENGFDIERVDSLTVVRRDLWSTFFVNCLSDQDVSEAKDLLVRTPPSISQRIGLQLSQEGILYTQSWTLILGRRKPAMKEA